MNENTEQKNVENGENTQAADRRKGKPKWLKIGCGCLIVAVIGFIALGAIAYSCSTPEEREQWAAERAERDKQYQAERAERQRRSEAERLQKQAAADQASAYWSKDNAGSIPYLKAERLEDIDSKQDIIRISAGSNENYRVMFQLPAINLHPGFSYVYQKTTEDPKSGYFFRLDDGKKQWRIFDNSDSRITVKVKSISDAEKKIIFNLSGIIRNAVHNPKSESSFFEPVPGKDTMNLNLDIAVWGEDFSKIMQQTSNSQSLKINGVYRLEKITALAPSPKPEDPAAAIKQMKKIQPGCYIRITGGMVVDGNKWYQVDVYASNAKRYEQPIAAGWINSVGLVAQNLVKVK